MALGSLQPLAAVVRFIDAINTADLDALGRFMTDDHRLVVLDEVPVEGRAANVEAWRGYFGSFPEYVIHPRQMTVEGGRVTVVGATTGSHLGLPDQEELQIGVTWRAEVNDKGALSLWQVASAPRAGYHSVTPRIVVDDLAGQVAFLREVFDAEGEVEPGRPAELRIGDSLVMVSAAGSERDAHTAFLYVYVADADRTFERAVAAGAETLEEPLDTPYGDRRAMVRDPFGNLFQIARYGAPT